MRLIKSGIPGLDKILGGGFLEGSIVTVGGPTGSGRSTFALQFLLESEEPALFISIEESKKDILFHMSGYKWDLLEEEKNRRLVILDYPIYEVDQILNQYSAIQEIIQSTGVKRLVIDSIMPIALYFPNEDERKKGFLKLIDNVRKWGVTTLIVAQDSRAQDVSTLPYTNFGIENFTDGWINIYYQYDEKKGERTRSVEVLKMKGVEHSTKHYPAVMDRNGFTIFSDQKPKSESEPPKQVVKKSPVTKAKEKAVKQAARKVLKKLTKKKTLGIRSSKR
jgi:KaiC/GvpD/RAD55 family RecA-like ATPase